MPLLVLLFVVSFVIIALQIIDVLKKFDKEKIRQIKYKRLYIDILVFCLSNLALMFFSILSVFDDSFFVSLVSIIIIYITLFDFSAGYLKVFFKDPSWLDVFFMGMALFFYPLGIYYLQYKFRHIIKDIPDNA
ncbi:MAG TPA: hypothetical protein VK559_08550 [Ferruginibacter sp.]|nr:hypothetical protein [Ferruginibacter sp.]